MIKIFKCKYCNSLGSRHYVRKCILTHIKTDKYPFRKNNGKCRKESNITQTLRENVWQR